MSTELRRSEPDPVKAHEDRVSKEWRDFTDPIAQIGRNTASLLLHPNDADARYDLYRSLLAQLGAGFFARLHADPQYPDFWPIYSSAFNSQAPNPDNSHYLTPIDDIGVYKISGFRGTVKRVSFSVGTGTLYTKGNMEGGAIRSLGEYDLDDLPLGSDGGFEVILSPEPPADYSGPWWKLSPGATNILVRQTSYDWLNEVDARLAIDRLDTPAAKPRPTAEVLAQRMRGLAQYAEFPVRVTVGYFNAIREKFGFNQLGYIDNSGWAPVLAQRYAYGAFDLADDEALLVEAKLPKKSRYWSVHLAEEIGTTLDYVNRQTSLNGFTARTDSDGYFRTVISAQDPGVPNWLDTTGLRTGIIQARFEGCDTWPEFKTGVIAIADVRKHVPTDTPTVTAEQRDAAIRVRRKGAQMRKRW
jgi:Protein of unknown function (DUF1214)